MVTRPTCILFLGGRMSFQWCVFLSANKSSPSLPLGYSYIHSFKSLPVTTMFNGTSIYRCSQRPLNLPTLEQEAGLAEPEPAMCPCNKESQQHSELCYEECSQQADGDVIPALSSVLLRHTWVPAPVLGSSAQETGTRWREDSHRAQWWPVNWSTSRIREGWGSWTCSS